MIVVNGSAAGSLAYDLKRRVRPECCRPDLDPPSTVEFVSVPLLDDNSHEERLDFLSLSFVEIHEAEVGGGALDGRAEEEVVELWFDGAVFIGSCDR